MVPASKAAPLPLYQNIASSSIASCVAEDTAKVRLQLQARGKTGGARKYRGIFGTVGTMAHEEGAAALWKGLMPGLQRQVIYGGLRIGLYDPIKNLMMGEDTKGNVPFYKKVAAGLTTSSIAITIASPTDLVKVRMQAEEKLPPGVPKRYPSSVRAYGMIARQEGVSALWTGLGPNIARNCIVSTTQLVAYDSIKQALLNSGYFKDDVLCHLASGLSAGFLSTVTGSPVDVVKSRMMGAAHGTYSGVMDAILKTWQRDGFLAFYSGFTSNFARLGSWNTIMWATLEQTKMVFEKINNR
ncbi:hypothetical protein N2152v2_002716 [Parachlorella kessleri]